MAAKYTVPSALLTKDISAQLSFDDSPSSDDGFSYKSVRALETRQGGLFGEPLSEYVGRMQELSRFFGNDVKYMRDLPVPARASMLCRCVARVLKEKGLVGCDVFAIQPPSSYVAEPTVPVVIAPAGELAVAAGILKGWLCHADSDLSTAGGKGALVFFDRHPILVLPPGAMSHFERTEPSVFRTPLLYNFHPDERLRAELSDTFTGKYAVMR